MEETVYVRMRHRVQVRPHQTVFVKDVVQLVANDRIYHQLNEVPVHEVKDCDKSIIIIDVMKVVGLIKNIIPEVEVQTIGPTQTIIEVMHKKKLLSVPFFFLVWFLLFFGAALAIMNFHEDVSMQSVHQRIYTLITGKEERKPLLFQIPYSVGLGLGMILFFNHVFKKRLNEEPSPLEVEMFNYQQDLDQYVIMHENKESVKHLDDR